MGQDSSQQIININLLVTELNNSLNTEKGLADFKSLLQFVESLRNNLNGLSTNIIELSGKLDKTISGLMNNIQMVNNVITTSSINNKKIIDNLQLMIEDIKRDVLEVKQSL